jgi:nucleoside-diphosphate-sugar epimerase
MARAIVIGGGGYVGRRLLARLAQAGWTTRTLVLPGDPAGAIPPVQLVRGDRRQPGVLDALLAGGADVVFDLVAYRPQDSARLVAACTGRIGRLVHLSSVSVYRDYPDEGSAAEGRLPMHTGAGADYGSAKAACEQVLARACAEQACPAVILRAAPLTGSGDPCSREVWFMKRILENRPIIHPGPADGRLWMLHVDDLVDALLRAASAPDAVHGRTFHLACPDAPTLEQHVAALAADMHRLAPPLLLATLPSLLAWGFRVYGFPYARAPLVTPDVTAARGALEWQPRPWRSMVRELVAAIDCTTLGHAASWPGRATVQARLAGTHEWLHDAQERLFLQHVPTAPHGAGQAALLDCLAGAPASADAPALVLAPAEEWPQAAQPGLVVTVPRALLARMGVAPAQLDAAPMPGRLVAALEPDPWDSGLAWLFDGAPAPGVQSYALSDTPVALRLLPYAALEADASAPRELALLLATAPVDTAALLRHLRGCASRGMLEVADLGAWARMYLVGSVAWAATAHAGAGWVRSHAVARLLVRAGLNGGVTMRMSAALPRASALCHIGDSWFLADLASERVVALAPALAAVFAPAAAPS